MSAPRISMTPLRIGGGVESQRPHRYEVVEEKAQRNREQMPLVSQMVDECRSVFGDGIKVVYAQEGQHTRGRRVDEGVVPVLVKK